MKNKDFQKMLQEYPDDYNVVVSGVASIPAEEDMEEGDGDDVLIVMDAPIIGVAINADDTEIRFLIESDALKALDRTGRENMGVDYKEIPEK
jgi:hypothetical protein